MYMTPKICTYSYKIYSTPYMRASLAFQAPHSNQPLSASLQASNASLTILHAAPPHSEGQTRSPRAWSRMVTSRHIVTSASFFRFPVLLHVVHILIIAVLFYTAAGEQYEELSIYTAGFLLYFPVSGELSRSTITL